MSSDYTVDLTADVDVVPDGGRVSHLAFRYLGRPVLAGLIVEYEDGFIFCDEIGVNDLLLPTPTARRLLSVLYRKFMPMIGAYGDCGLIAPLCLQDFLLDNYEDTDERHKLTSLIETVRRTFLTPTKERHEPD